MTNRRGIIGTLLTASVAVFIIVIAFITLSPGVYLVNQQIVNQYGTLSLNGLTVATLSSNTFELFEAGLSSTLVFIVGYVFFAAHAQEQDSGEIFDESY